MGFQVDTSKKFKNFWRGPCYGGDILAVITKNLEAQIGCFFHSLYFKVEDYLTFDLDFIFNNIILGESHNEEVFFSETRHHSYAHQINSKLNFLFANNWKIATSFYFYKFKVKRKARLATMPDWAFLDQPQLNRGWFKCSRHFCSVFL